jgi:hypothetical protein
MERIETERDIGVGLSNDEGDPRRWVEPQSKHEPERGTATDRRAVPLTAITLGDAELPRANEILKAASRCSRPSSTGQGTVIAFIDQHKDHRVAGGLRWGVEPFVRHAQRARDLSVSSSTFYECVAGVPSRRQLRNEQVAGLIRAERETNKLRASKQPTRRGSPKLPRPLPPGQRA